MINKKAVLIIILAAVLAAIAASCMFNFMKHPTDTKQIENKTEQPVQEEVLQQEPEKTEPEEKKPAEPASQPKASKSAKSKKTTIRKVSYNKPPVPTVEQDLPAVKEPKPLEENIVETKLTNEESSTDIIITTEYKMKSPSKYSFK